MNATVYPIPSRLEAELVACGWTEASHHFDRACNAAIARDDDAFTREMAEFNRIKATWGKSIDYRKERTMSDSLLIAQLHEFCQKLDRQDALLVRRAIDELRDLQHELSVTNELISDGVIRPGPNFEAAK